MKYFFLKRVIIEKNNHSALQIGSMISNVSLGSLQYNRWWLVHLSVLAHHVRRAHDSGGVGSATVIVWLVKGDRVDVE